MMLLPRDDFVVHPGQREQRFPLLRHCLFSLPVHSYPRSGCHKRVRFGAQRALNDCQNFGGDCRKPEFHCHGRDEDAEQLGY